MHAGGVEAGGTGVLIPGGSGSGKSTLVAGLVRAGLGYLTDELAALDMASGKLDALPQADHREVRELRGALRHGPDVSRGPGHGPWAGKEWQLAVGEGTGRRVGGPCEAGFVVVPRYDATAETGLTPLSATQAFLALAVNAVNLIPHGSAGTRVLGRLAVRSRCFSLTVSDLDVACRLVLELVEAPAARGGAGREL